MSLVIEENNSTEIVNVNAENIMQEVIEASSEKAVIVQFWAPWCGPCKQLAPVLEKVCAKFKNIKLTKINIDENQEIAAQMRVQSVPTVFGFLNGQPVDGFAGAQPESAVTQFVEKLSEAAPGQADISGLLQSGTNALGENEPEKAMQAFQQALSLSPESPEAIAGFIRCLIALGEHEEAKAVLDQLDEDMQKKPIIKDVLAALAVAKKGAEVDSDKSDLERKVQSNPKDLQARQELAIALFASGQQTEAMLQLLESIKIDPSWNENMAQTQLLEFFTALGHTHPNVIKARRKLSSYLFS
jgi:putative thioredoxin